MLKSFDLYWTESFLCAGSSALLISVAHAYPELWFFSLFALVPFLWRAIRVSLLEAGVLGGMLGLSYAFVATPIESWTSLGASVLTLVSLTFLFAIYGIVVNRIKKSLGFNAIFIAALWLPLEYAISHSANLGSLIAVAPDESGLLFRFGSLFGLLMVSFVIIVVNALILISVGRIVRALRSRHPHSTPGNYRVSAPPEQHLPERSWYCFPDVRAPPLLAVGLRD